VYDGLAKSTQAAIIQVQRKPPYSTAKNAKSAKNTKNRFFALFASFAVLSFGCDSVVPGVSRYPIRVRHRLYSTKSSFSQRENRGFQGASFFVSSYLFSLTDTRISWKLQHLAWKEVHAMDLRLMVEKNRKWLRFYANVARVIGWLLIAWGCGALVRNVEMGKEMLASIKLGGLFSPVERQLFVLVLPPLRRVILPGLLALLVAQLLRFLLNRHARPGWLLGQGDKLLFFASLISLISFLLHLSPLLRHAGELEKLFYPVWLTLVFENLPMLLRAGTELMILVGLALIFRRLIPIIRESKSLA
jgi:hypothetical protein